MSAQSAPLSLRVGSDVYLDLTSHNSIVKYEGLIAIQSRYVGNKGNWMLFVGEVPNLTEEDQFEQQDLVYRVAIKEKALQPSEHIPSALAVAKFTRIKAEVAGPMQNRSLYHHIQSKLRGYW